MPVLHRIGMYEFVRAFELSGSTRLATFFSRFEECISLIEDVSRGPQNRHSAGPVGYGSLFGEFGEFAIEEVEPLDLRQHR